MTKAANLAALASGPAFLVYPNNQTIPTTTVTKIALANEVYDTNSNFDSTTNYRFQPTVAGYYQINLTVMMNAAAGTGGVVIGYIYKNGSTYAQVTEWLNTNATPLSGSGSILMYLNGSSDYVEFYVFQSQGSNQTLNGGGTTGTTASGFLARAA